MIYAVIDGDRVVALCRERSEATIFANATGYTIVELSDFSPGPRAIATSVLDCMAYIETTMAE